MRGFGDDGSEMPRPVPFDDDAIDALVAGNAPVDDGAGVAAFVADVRAAAARVPTPSASLAAAIAAGGISTYPPPVAKWRKFRMKIQGFVAGLGIAGKLALGVGVAAAATTGAGAAGVLPDSVQHVVSKAFGTVTPFSFPDPEHHGSSGGDLASGEPGSTTTTLGDVSTTTAPGSHDGEGDGPGGAVTPTTTGDHNGVVEDTTTTVAHDGSGDGHDSTPTTEHQGDGDSNNPESLSIHCERATGPARIGCSWSASTSADHARYVLLRVGGDQSRVVLESEDALHFTDTSVVAGTGYGYRVDSLRADGTVEAHSPMFTIECCGDAPTTTTTEHHEATTTNTEHHEATTTTTVHSGDGTTTTTAPH